jgi:hypothetical protein
VLLRRVEMVVADDEMLRVYPAKLSKHVYAYAMFKILITSSEVIERHAPILESIRTISEENTTLIVPERIYT